MITHKLEGKAIPEPNQHTVKAAVLGPCNAGKSSLVNALAGHAVAVSRKGRTTVEPLQALHSFERQQDGATRSVQALLWDTPGTVLAGRALRSPGWQVLSEVSLAFVVLDACKRMDLLSRQTLARLQHHLAQQPALKAVLVVNKLDKAENPHRLTELVTQAEASCKFAATVLTSTLTGRGLDDLRGHLARTSTK
jgi:small GTP-binding protein